MIRFFRIALVPLLLVLVAGFALACDGDDNGGDPTATAAMTGEPDDATEAPGATATESASGTAIAGHIEGDFVAPNSHAFTQRFEVGGLSGEQSVVIIGPDAWVREGSGDWERLSSDDPEVIDLLDLTSGDVDFLDSTELGDDLAALDSESEEINGVATRRYFIPREAVATLVDVLGGDFIGDAAGLEEFEMTVWVGEESGAIIRAEIEAIAGPDLLGGGTGFDISPDSSVQLSLTIDRTQINDPDIVIEPPEGEASDDGGDSDRPFESYHYTVDLVVEILEQ